MKVLVACEFSGVVRGAFAGRGHDAWSCDLLESDEEGKHLKGDVRRFLDRKWDLLIAHPPCTYFANSGVRWLKNQNDPGYGNLSRWAKLDQAADLFNALLDAPIPKICVENPIPHKYAVTRIKDRNWNQLIQPYMFGHLESKATCLWLQGLNPLTPTSDFKAKTKALPKSKSHRVHYMTPSPDRWKHRSITSVGIAEAMAEQWGTP